MLLLVAAWAALAVTELLATKSDLQAARDDLSRLRDEVQGSELIDDATMEELATVGRRVEQARARVRSPVVSPLRALPVVGRQLRSVDALSAGVGEAVDVSVQTIDRLQGSVHAAERPATDRLELVAQLRDTAHDARTRLSDIDLGPDRALVGSLAEARHELEEDLGQIVQMAGDVETAASGIEALMTSEDCYLLFAANNAEMRAGSGMFLQAGPLCFADGAFTLRDMRPTGELLLDEGVPIADPDLDALWGFLEPNREFRNLGLSPRFPANAALAADMWEAATGERVGGVLAADPVALAAVVAATGPVVVETVSYDADSTVDELTKRQYDVSEGPVEMASQRQDRLGEVAIAAVNALSSGGLALDELLDTMPEAVAGRHLLGWSRDPRTQDAFEAMGMTGSLHDDSLAVSVLNRGGGSGGGKLDPFLEVAARLETTRRADETEVTVRIRLTNTVPEGVPTYVEYLDDDVRFGVYEGILAVNVPGSTTRATIERDGERLPLYTRGADGPTRALAVRVELGPSSSRSYTLRFRVPSSAATVTVEPSARVPEVDWVVPGGRHDGGDSFQVSL